MRTFALGFCLLVAICVALVPVAHAAKNSGIVVLDAPEVLNKTNAAKRAVEVLRKKTEAAQKQIDDMEKELIARRDELSQKQSLLSPEKLEEEKLKLNQDFRDFRNKAQSIQEDLDRQNTLLRKEITDEINAVVQEIAKEKDVEIVVAKNLLFFADDSIDISEEVLKRVNKRLDKKAVKK